MHLNGFLSPHSSQFISNIPIHTARTQGTGGGYRRVGVGLADSLSVWGMFFAVAVAVVIGGYL
jgi:hypothetical protein